jgi:hypothetical protein
MIRFPDAEILKKDFIQFIIVILAGMHQDMLGVAVQLADDPAKLNDFRTGTYDGHDLC